MPLPFQRTLSQARRRGFVKTVSILIAVLMKKVSIRFRYVPKTAIVEINKSKMLLYPRKGAIHFELFLHKKREPICTDYLLKSGILRKDNVALDIGANIGYYALVEAKLVGTHGKVYAVEPVLENFDLLKKNVILNNLRNIDSYRFAFGEKVTKSKIYVSTSVNLCAMNRNFVGGEIIGEQEVTVETVDRFLEDKEFPKLIRMDVEGYEYEIIKGMPQTLQKDIDILVELHPHILSYKLDEILEILEQNNFGVRFVVFEGKVDENIVMKDLLKKSGDKMPIVASNISIQELKKLIDANPDFGPNVVFEKQHLKNQSGSIKSTEQLLSQLWLSPDSFKIKATKQKLDS
jgi:FkbM family methyltransferase